MLRNIIYFNLHSDGKSTYYTVCWHAYIIVWQTKTLSTDFPRRNVTAARLSLESYRASALAGAGAAAIALGLDPAEESRWITEARVHLPG